MQRVCVDVPAWDFASVYAATRTWVHGGDPFDLPSDVKTWRAAGAFSGRDASYFTPVYPPSSLVMIVPLSVLLAGAAMSVWMGITIVFLVWQFAAPAEMAFALHTQLFQNTAGAGVLRVAAGEINWTMQGIIPT